LFRKLLRLEKRGEELIKGEQAWKLSRRGEKKKIGSGEEVA
jgi:hypothetical protein